MGIDNESYIEELISNHTVQRIVELVGYCPLPLPLGNGHVRPELNGNYLEAFNMMTEIEMKRNRLHVDSSYQREQFQAEISPLVDALMLYFQPI